MELIRLRVWDEFNYRPNECRAAVETEYNVSTVSVDFIKNIITCSSLSFCLKHNVKHLYGRPVEVVIM